MSQTPQILIFPLNLLLPGSQLHPSTCSVRSLTAVIDSSRSLTPTVSWPASSIISTFKISPEFNPAFLPIPLPHPSLGYRHLSGLLWKTYCFICDYFDTFPIKKVESMSLLETGLNFVTASTNKMQRKWYYFNFLNWIGKDDIISTCFSPSLSSLSISPRPPPFGALGCHIKSPFAILDKDFDYKGVKSQWNLWIAWYVRFTSKEK